MQEAGRQAEPTVWLWHVAMWHARYAHGEWQIVTIATSFNQLPFPNHIAHCIISAAIAANKEQRKRDRDRTREEEQKQQKGK